MERPKRFVAYKLRIEHLLSGKPIMESERFNFLELGNKQIARVNVVANVVERFFIEENERKFASITLDDASGQIRVRAFGDDIEKLRDIVEGDTIRVIGMLRFFNNEIYILPEIVKKVDPRYLLVRKLELEAESEQDEIRKEDSQEIKEEKKALRDLLLDKIKAAEPEGIETEKLILEIQAAPELINEEITKLLEEGLIFEPRPGRVRYLG